MNETQEMLRDAFLTKNPLTFPVSATGMAGMEACMVNLIEPGDKIVVCVDGFFGQRMVDVAGRTGAQVTVLERPWGDVFDLNRIRDTLKQVRPKVLGIVHAETSTGAWQPIEELGKLCHEFDTLLVVDAVTSLGCVPLRRRRLGDRRGLLVLAERPELSAGPVAGLVQPACRRGDDASARRRCKAGTST